MAATYKDIQRMTRLSLATISKYFNGGNVRPDNRRAIEKAIKELDFRVNEYARGLKSRRSHMIGGLIPELNGTFATQIMADVEEYLRRNGYGLMLCSCRQDRNLEGEALDFLLGRMVDGIISIPHDHQGLELQRAASSGVPVVLIDRMTTDFETDMVVVDNREAAHTAVQEFVEKGHKNLAFLCGPENIYTMKERKNGFREALGGYGLPVREEWIITGPMTMDGGYMMAKRLFSLAEQPTGIFCANYDITLGAILAMNELGIRMADDVSLIGFDNLMLSGIVKPNLTMIVQPMQELAHLAAGRLIDRIEGRCADEPPKVIRLKTQIVRGQSVKKL